ncbi:hypothetical protein [Poritiphilus flavus]|uniref:DUF1735 domain-containing protein n=1 Tax=Poritiphilus flavus TaxID=2697053 RepID=A0A6L9EI87_9FLAO|nr:hypothetical protein [Poritiphilus flavus]NAS14403.1 hypothetical protein [Poritiphilus flavus]
MMKNIIYKFSCLLFGALLVLSCEENEIIQFDAQNGRAIAGFGGGNEAPRIVFNPAENTDSKISVGVSSLSSSPRSVQLEVDATKSTLDPSFYTIDNLSPVIDAGAFTTEITITTVPGTDLPGASDALVLKLVSVESAEILETSIDELAIGLDVQCPSVDISALAGSYEVVDSTFADFFGETDDTREVVLGPGANQITIIDGTYINEGADDLILTIDPETGSIIGVNEDGINSQVSFGPNFYVLLPGGRVLTCVGIIEMTLDFSANIAGNPHVFNLVKQ